MVGAYSVEARESIEQEERGPETEPREAQQRVGWGRQTGSSLKVDSNPALTDVIELPHA